MHEAEEALVLLLSALDELQSKGLVAAKGAYSMLHLFLLFSAELNKKFKQGLIGQIGSAVKLLLHFPLLVKPLHLPKTANHLQFGQPLTFHFSCVLLPSSRKSSLE